MGEPAVTERCTHPPPRRDRALLRDLQGSGAEARGGERVGEPRARVGDHPGGTGAVSGSGGDRAVPAVTGHRIVAADDAIAAGRRVLASPRLAPPEEPTSSAATL